MNIIQRIFAWLDDQFAQPIEHFIHHEEKEIEMIPQNISDAIAKIKDLLSSKDSQSSADAQTISTLQGQVADLTSQGAAKDAQITDLTSQLADAQSQLSDIENAVLGLVPAAQ